MRCRGRNKLPRYSSRNLTRSQGRKKSGHLSRSLARSLAQSAIPYKLVGYFITKAKPRMVFDPQDTQDTATRSFLGGAECCTAVKPWLQLLPMHVNPFCQSIFHNKVVHSSANILIKLPFDLPLDGMVTVWWYTLYQLSTSSTYLPYI